jgi:hypothetical protein
MAVRVRQHILTKLLLIAILLGLLKIKNQRCDVDSLGRDFCTRIKYILRLGYITQQQYLNHE